MKTTIHTPLAVVILGLASGAFAAWCEYKPQSEDILFWYNIQAYDVDDIPSRCGGFWDNMKHKDWHGACLALSDTHCYEGQPGEMILQFRAGHGCHEHYVEWAWGQATGDQFGVIDCQPKYKYPPSEK